MKNFMHTVLNAEIPVIYIGVIVHIYVKCVLRHSVNRAILNPINTHTVVNARMFVMCVIRHSFYRAVFFDITAYTVVSALILVMCAIRHSV
jgi:hypothetical protein